MVRDPQAKSHAFDLVFEMRAKGIPVRYREETKKGEAEEERGEGGEGKGEKEREPERS